MPGAFGLGAVSLGSARAQPAPPAAPIELTVDTLALRVGERVGTAVAMNGRVPGPLIRLREGQQAVLRVTNRLPEITSIHWHGLILPPGMDGVPGVSFAGIAPGETFEYRFPVVQSGTYWCHSHSGGQELLGLYAPLVIEPAAPEPFAYERDHVVMLSDWSFEPPERIAANLKKRPGYYNFQRRTLGEFARDARRAGLGEAVRDRLEWGRMRMDPTDFADVTGYTYTYLCNGLPPEANWTGLFGAGERVRLRFVDAGAMTYFDVRIPGLVMTVVQVDGQNVQPVAVDEFRIAPGETIDVIVEPEATRAYTVFAEAMDRSGYARGTLAPGAGLRAALPPRRPRPLRTMADMGMDPGGMGEHGAGGHAMAAGPLPPPVADHGASAGVDPQAGRHGPGPALQGPALPGSTPVPHGPDAHGPGNSAIPMVTRSRLDEPGSGLGEAGARVLTYAQLRSVESQPDLRAPAREIELHLTGNMERYMWSFDGKKYSEATEPIVFRHGERLRLVLVNDTMMEHPIHLHGMWMEIENGAAGHQPRKHTVSVKPAERLSVAITADAPGRWAMHCHLLLHMEMGMFRVVEVSPAEHAASAGARS